MKNIPNEKRYAAKTWQTSSGTFKTTHVGNLEMMFPVFFRSKIFAIRLNIVIVEKSDEEPMFDLIVGIKTIAKLSTVLNFQERTVQIDHVVVAVRPYTSLAQKSNICVEAFQTGNMYVPSSTGTFARNHSEVIIIRDATKRTI